MVAVPGLEPGTSSVSGKRSPSLSYTATALLAAGQETRRHVLLVNVLVIALLSLGAGIWIGTRIGGRIAVRRIAEFEYRTLTGRAGLRRK